MKCFRWLHFSDFHFGTKSTQSYWSGIKGRLLEDIRFLEAGRKGVWDALFLTGDLANMGKKEEYEKFQLELDDILTHLKATGSHPIVISVPGNHDLIRPDPDNTVFRNLKNSLAAGDTKQFWGGVIEDNDTGYRNLIFESFKNFLHWQNTNNQYAGSLEDTYIPGKLPGDFLLTLENEFYKIGIIGLNTAFTQLDGGNYRGKLEIHLEQLQQSVAIPEWAKQHDTCIVLTHHPYSWLKDTAQENFDNFIALTESVPLHCFGHQHENNIISTSTGSGSRRKEVQVRSLFGQKEVQDFKYGYHAGKIDFDRKALRMVLAPRLMIRANHSVWKFVRDQRSCLNDTKYTSEVDFERNRHWVPHLKKTTCPPGMELAGSIHFDCMEKHRATYLEKSKDITIIGLTNKNLPKILLDVFKKRQCIKWNSVKIVFTACHLLKYMQLKEFPTDVDQQEEQWTKNIQLVRFTLRKVAEKPAIYIYDKFPPFVGDNYNKNHSRIAYILPNTKPSNRCFLNIVGKMTHCKAINNDGYCDNYSSKIPDENQSCISCYWWEEGLSGCHKIDQSFKDVVAKSKKVISSCLSGYLKNDRLLYLNRLLPLHNWMKITFKDPSNGENINPVFPVILILLTCNDKIIMQQRTPENAGSVFQLGFISGKLQDEDFFQFSDNYPDYNTQGTKVDKIYNEYQELRGSRANERFADFEKESRYLTSMFKKITQLNSETPIVPEHYPSQWVKATKRTMLERTGLSVSAASLSPIDMEKYCIKQNLTVNRKEGGIHNVFFSCYTCDIDEITLEEIKDVPNSIHMKAYTLDEFEELYSNGNSEFTPFVSSNFKGLYAFFKDSFSSC